MTTLQETSSPQLSLATLPPADGWMANLHLLMSSRDDAYEAMRRAIPGLAWTLVDRIELTPRQSAAKEHFDDLNRQVRDFRSV